MAKPVNVFIFYAAEDASYHEALMKHLAELRNTANVTIWSIKILPGISWDEMTKDQLHQPDIVIFLVSDNFMNFDYILNKELRESLDRREKEEAVMVVPILVRPRKINNPISWHGQWFPVNLEAISVHTNQDEVWDKIALYIHDMMDNFSNALFDYIVREELVKKGIWPSMGAEWINNLVVGRVHAAGVSDNDKAIHEKEDGLESIGGEVPELETAPNEPFEAYPFISDPGDVKPGEVFTIDVGLSKQLDAALQHVHGISIARPGPDDFLQVSLMPIGAHVASNTLKKLPLDVDAKVTFHLKAHPTAEEISVVAMYFYNGQPVGTATRIINTIEKPVGNQILLNNPGTEPAASNIDLTAIIRWDKAAGQLRWKLVGNGIDHDEAKAIADTREFAAMLSAQLDPNNNEGQAAFNILTSLGETIAEHIPKDFFKALKTIGQTTQRPPRVLLWTDEAYIPWELAYDSELALNPQKEPILLLQTVIGRWWINDKVITPPPMALAVQNFSVIASTYEENPEIALLEEAGKERKFLIDTFKAVGVKAEKAAVLSLTGQKPPQSGHVLHLALHGISRPDLNEQEILLEDGNLNANALFGPYSPGDAPAVSFMFMNACQVGTAGQTLGQASGFPGVMLKKGLSGFIAPLWSVNDEQARHFCENFYNKTLSDARPVGEVLLELRQGVDLKKSLTELAYIYYGHPALQLTKNTPNGN